jgi:hypothetical protein
MSPAPTFRRRSPGRIGLLVLFVFAFGLRDGTRAETPGSGGSETLRILLLGNSYTFFNHLGDKLDFLLEQSGRPAEIVTVAQGGLKLGDHLQRGHLHKVSGPWSFVALQGQSQMPLRHPDGLAGPLAELVTGIEALDARPVLFMTWPRLARPEDGDGIARLYRRLADQHEALLAPVGEAFEQVRTADPGLHRRLSHRDGSHPSPYGTWLAALVFYGTLTGDDPRQLEPPTFIDAEAFEALARTAHQVLAPSAPDLPIPSPETQ